MTMLKLTPLDDVGASVARPALARPAGLQALAAAERATAALLPVDEESGQDGPHHHQRQHDGPEGVALEEVVDRLHHGTARPILVVGRVEQGAEGVVQDGVDSP